MATRKWLLALLVPICALCMVGCLDEEVSLPSPSPSVEQDSLESVTLKFMLFGEKPVDMQLVLNEFEERTENTLNVKLDMEWNAFPDYLQKTKLKLLAGDQIDALFDANWSTLTQNANQGLYRQLDSYFNNDQYPGLKKAFPQDMLEANQINGHIYTIPLVQFYTDLPVVFIRKDLREKYDLPPIQSYEDLQVFYEKIQKNDEGMIPLAAGGIWGFYEMFYPEKHPNNVVYHKSFGSGVEWNIAISDDGKKVLGASTFGDAAVYYKDFPAPYNEPDFVYRHLEKAVHWNRFISKDPISMKNGGELLTAGIAASTLGKVGGFHSLRKSLQEVNPDADLEYFVYSSACARNLEKGCIGTDFKAWNNIVVPITSENPDRVMKIFDWLFSDPSNHDLFELGIEGKHWTAVEEDEYSLTDESANYVFPNYEMTWHRNLSRTFADNEEELKKLYKYEANLDTYYPLPLSNFVFNTETVKNEVAKVSSKWSEANQILKNGVVKDWKGEADKLNKVLMALGLDIIRNELIEQIQKYLDEGGK
jgi:ABC-type glycerol-3-phosphate transport system substrate-binding protein